MCWAPRDRLHVLPEFYKRKSSLAVVVWVMALRKGRSARGVSCFRAFCQHLRRDLLLVLIVLGVILGFVVGAAVNGPIGEVVDPEERATILMLIGFPGELFMNMLKMLILPLIVASLICALSTLEKEATGKIGRRTVLYYLTTTLVAVVLGIVLVISIRPGDSGQGADDKEDVRGPHRNLDSFLDLIRYASLLLFMFCPFKATSLLFGVSNWGYIYIWIYILF